MNAYLIEDEPLTLIDSGPELGARRSTSSSRRLRALGHRIEDIELLVITHQHIDHFGLAGVARAALRGARRGARRARPLPQPLPRGGRARGPLRGAHDATARHPRRTSSTALRAVSASFRGWGSTVEVARPCATATSWSSRAGRCGCFTARATAPRTRSSSTRRAGLLIAGDHLIAPHLLEPDRRAAARGARRVHGPAPARAPRLPRLARRRRARWSSTSCSPDTAPPITDHAAVIDSRMRLHARRAERILGLIETEPLTAHEMARAAVGKRRGHAGLPHALGGPRPPRPPDRGRSRRRAGARRRRALPRGMSETAPTPRMAG